MAKTVYLSLGSNIGDRRGHLQAAIEQLAAAGISIQRVSPIYETEPIGAPGKPQWFLNLSAEAETELFPMQLLSRTQKIESTLGRVRTVRNGPRTVDIDILLYGKAVVRAARLVIPHPRMHERRFVLVPLADLAPDLRHPVTRLTVREMLDAAPAAVVRRYAESLESARR